MIPAWHTTRRPFVPLVMGWILLAVGLLATPVRAQETLTTRFEEGRAAFDAGRYEEAVQHFEAVFEQQPAFRLGRQGAIAYWLGKAYDAADAAAQACQVWQAGVSALAAAGLFDVPLADAYVRCVFRQRRQLQYVQAVDAYLHLLERAGTALQPPEQEILHRHLAQLAFLLSGAWRSQIIDEAAEPVPPGRLAIKAGAGPRLLAWWNSQDPLPRTPWNERIAEHLERVAEAEHRYQEEHALTGFDDRGMIYVRLGEPSHVTQIENDFLKTGLPDDVDLRALILGNRFAPGVAQTVSPPSRNEFWSYAHVGAQAHYLFIAQGAHYRLLTSKTLLPTELRPGFSPSEQGFAKLLVSMAAHHETYDRLSKLNPAYTRRFFDIDNYVRRWVEGSLGPSDGSPSVFLERFIAQGEGEDRRQARLREETVPRVHTDAYQAAPLPVIARVARFLDDDGTTQTDTYWAFPPRAFMPSLGTQFQIKNQGYALTDRYVFQLTAVQEHADYQPRKRTRHRLSLPENYTDEITTIPVHTTVVRGDSGLYHLSLEWDQYMETGPDQAGATPRLAYVKTGTYHADSLQALVAAPGVLEMSDLVPFLAADVQEKAMIRDERGFQVRPYPFARLVRETPLALYFEVYHLTYGADDQTHFTVEYEVTRRRENGQEEHTATESSYTGSSRTAAEYIVLDLREWDGEGMLSIRVRVTDERTTQHVERSLAFTLSARSCYLCE